MMDKSTAGSSFTFLAWTFKIASRPRTSGKFTTTCRSNRPGDDNNAFLRVETVHLDQQRVQGLLSLVVAAAEAMAAGATHSVNFVNEHQARCIAACLFEHVAHATRADADEHFHEI